MEPTCDAVLDVLLDGWSPTGRHRVLQTAPSGRWEQAISTPMPAGADAARRLVRGAGPAGTDVAVELEWLGQPLAFVGARRGAGEGAAFEDDVAAVASADLRSPAEALHALAGGAPVDADAVELGAANAWQSIGPLRLWTRGEPSPERTVAERLRAHPTLARCVVPVALEVSFRGPRECWAGVALSEPEGERHVIDPARVEVALGRLLAG